MSAALPALLAGGAVAVVLGAPGRSALRLRALVPTTAGPAAGAVGLVPAAGPAPRTVLAALLVAGVLLLGPGPTVLVTAAAGGVLWSARSRSRRRADDLERRSAVEACAALALELRAGRVPAQALAQAAALARGPCREALRAAAAAAQWGGDVPAALLAPSTRPGAVPDLLRGLAACWQVCAQAGAGLAAAVERLADGLRAREAQERAVAAALAGPRASAALLALLPLAGIALAAGLGARPLHVLLHTPLGLVCLVAGLGLDATGLWWTGRLVARAAALGR